VKLCEALAATNQEHVVRDYLSREQQGISSRGRPAATDHTAACTWTAYSRPGMVVEAWRSVLVQNRSAIIELLDSSDEFVDRLVTYGVMNLTTGELCRVNLIQFQHVRQ